METNEVPAKKRPPLWLRLIFGSNPSWTIVRMLLLIGLTFLLFKFILGLIRVTGSSMEPTYHDGQIKIVNRLAYRRSPPRRGDIVAIFYAGREVLLIKRIVGLPGETVQVAGGKVYIDGERLDEPYAAGAVPRPIRPFKLEAHEYWVIGDNRKVSEDLRESDEKFYGKVIF
jgi:signal peptidase I